MIKYIIGRYMMNTSNGIVIENDFGIGFNIIIPMSSPIYNHELGETIKVFTELVLRENDIKLYGFHNLETLELFNLLTTVSGIGPKGAISILDAFDTNELKIAIKNEDSILISKANGVGKKTAERVVLELKDKVLCEGESIKQTQKLNYEKDEAVSALISLGYSKNEALKSVECIEEKDLSSEEYIKKALKNLI